MKKQTKSAKSANRKHKISITLYNIRYSFRIVIGIVLSVVIAQLVGLKFAPSTCIVTLLGIQMTRRDTIYTAVERVISLGYTMSAAFFAHWLLGSNITAFFLSVLIMTLITVLFKWMGTMSINVVVLVHLFLQQVPFTTELIYNELLRVFIGLSIALLVNWKMPSKENEFRRDIAQIEKKMQNILGLYAEVLRNEREITPELSQQLAELEGELTRGMDNAYIFANNNLSSNAKYYMKYVSMRQTETVILNKVNLNLQKLTIKGKCSKAVADYIDAIGYGIPLEQPVDDLKQKQEAVNAKFIEAGFPSSEDEMRAFSLLCFIKGSLEEMIEAKEEFINALSDEEKKRYWNLENNAKNIAD